MQARDTIGHIMMHLLTCKPTVSPVRALKKTVEPDTVDEIDEVEKGKVADAIRPAKV